MTAEVPAGPPDPTDRTDAGDRRPRREQPPGSDKRTLVITMVALIALILVAAVFLVSFSFTGAADPDRPAPAPTRSATSAPTATPTPSPTRTVALAPAAPAGVGTWKWTELAGGECLEPFATPWAEEFTVVACDAAHHGQLVRRGSFSDDPAATYPGEAAFTSQLGLLCSAPEVIDYGRAEAYPDVQLQSSYPPDEASWNSGQRSYFCFASRSGGEAFTGSIAVG